MIIALHILLAPESGSMPPMRKSSCIYEALEHIGLVPRREDDLSELGAFGP